MRRPLLLALACGALAPLAAAPAQAAPKPPAPKPPATTMGRHATFMLELSAHTEIRWTYTVEKHKRNCYEYVASDHEGMEEWNVRTRAPVRVTALDAGTLVMVSGDPLNPAAGNGITVAGNWKRDTNGSDVTTPGECGGGTLVRRADRADCGMQLPEQNAGLVFARGYAIVNVRDAGNLARRFDRCRLLTPRGMLPGDFPTDDDGVMMRFDPNRLFGREKAIELRGSRTFRGLDTEYSSATGKASWTAKLTRVERTPAPGSTPPSSTRRGGKGRPRRGRARGRGR